MSAHRSYEAGHFSQVRPARSRNEIVKRMPECAVASDDQTWRTVGFS
jgi:hypothetical protein